MLSIQLLNAATPTLYVQEVHTSTSGLGKYSGTLLQERAQSFCLPQRNMYPGVTGLVWPSQNFSLVSGHLTIYQESMQAFTSPRL